jgi:hypothetical protein
MQPRGNHRLAWLSGDGAATPKRRLGLYPSRQDTPPWAGLDRSGRREAEQSSLAGEHAGVVTGLHLFYQKNLSYALQKGCQNQFKMVNK